MSMSKRKNKKTSIILCIVAVLLVVVFTVPLIMNFDSLFNNNEQVNDEDNNKSDDNITNEKLKVYFNDELVKSGDVIEVKQSEVSFVIECEEEYQASFVAFPEYKSWEYQVGEGYYLFNADVSVLETSFSDGKVTISLPYDIMDWVKLQHKDVVEEDIILPTNVNHNVAYIALEIKVGEETYLYPIKFDLNGVWTKVYLDKNEIVFCD